MSPPTTIQPPYYAVVFSSLRSGADDAGYAEMASQMSRLAAEQPGFLGEESARGADGFGITVSYWRDTASIRRWREVAEHQRAQRLGRSQWYRSYQIRVCRVEREDRFMSGNA